MPIKYKVIIRMIQKKDKHNYRLELVRYAMKHGISATAEAYQTTRKTVRKWRNRYKEQGIKGLQDISSAPHNVHNKMSIEEEQKILELRDSYKDWSAGKLKEMFGIKRCENAIHRVIKQNGRVRKKKKRWKRSLDLREEKARLKPFEKMQWDTKDLSDIESFYTYMIKNGLPRYQFTARDTRTGSLYISYGHSPNSSNMALFARYVLEHLRKNGVELEGMIHQTDNGAEFQATTIKKHKGAFEAVIEESGGIWKRIPPRACTWQSDVERSHGLIESDLYLYETFNSKEEFFGKAFAYQIFFNNYRPNRYKIGGKPISILRAVNKDISNEININENVLNLLPILLDNYVDIFNGGGYKVRIADIKIIISC